MIAEGANPRRQNKQMKTVWNIIWRVLLAVVLLLYVAVALVNYSVVQSYLGTLAGHHFSNQRRAGARPFGPHRLHRGHSVGPPVSPQHTARNTYRRHHLRRRDPQTTFPTFPLQERQHRRGRPQRRHPRPSPPIPRQCLLPFRVHLRLRRGPALHQPAVHHRQLRFRRAQEPAHRTDLHRQRSYRGSQPCPLPHGSPRQPQDGIPLRCPDSTHGIL